MHIFRQRNAQRTLFSMKKRCTQHNSIAESNITLKQNCRGSMCFVRIKSTYREFLINNTHIVYSHSSKNKDIYIYIYLDGFLLLKIKDGDIKTLPMVNL